MAFGPWHGRHETAKSADELRNHMQDRLEFVLDRLDATDAQRREVHTIAAKAAPEMFAIAREGRSLRVEIKESLTAATIDKARIERAHQALNALAARATDVGTRTLLAVAETLTPEQRQRVSEHFARMHGEP
jgi:Spy/CpxP family protein refolding chaperone